MFCDRCEAGLSGAGCDIPCSAAANCSDSGMCLEADGSCECDAGFVGPACGECDEGLFGPECATECDEAETCSDNGRCGAGGVCLCFEGFIGVACDICGDGLRGAACDVPCDDRTNCSGNGRCIEVAPLSLSLSLSAPLFLSSAIPFGLT